MPSSSPLGLASPFRSGEPIRVVLADDEGLFRACLRQLLAIPAPVIKEVYGVNVGAGFDVVGEAGSGEETVKIVQSVTPDLVLLDLVMPRMSGIDALRELEVCHGATRTILFAETINRMQLLAALQLGVRGLVLKESATENLFEAMVRVIADQYWLEQTLMTDLVEWVRALMRATHGAPGNSESALTERQREVLVMVIAGHANKEIARKFAVSEETIKHHLTRIFNKVGVSNRLELALQATQRGLDHAVSGRSASAPNRRLKGFSDRLLP